MFASQRREALAALQDEPFDVFLVELPGSHDEDRIEMLSTLAPRHDRPPAAVLAATRSEADGVRRNALDAGAADFLSLPVDAIELAIRIRSILELRDARALACSRDEEHVASQRYRSIIDSIPEAIGTADAEGRLNFVNPAGAEMFGYTVEEMLGHLLIDFVPHERAKRMVLEAIEQIRQGAIVQNEFWARRKDGTEMWVMTSGRALYDHRRYIGVVGNVVDISDRHRMEVALEASQQRLSLAMMAADIGLWDWDLVADAVYLSPEFVRLLGYGEAEIHLASPWFRDRLHPEDVEPATRIMEEHLQGKTAQSVIEYRARQASGDYVWLRSIGKVVARDPSGQPSRMTGVVVDISEAKRTEDALRAAIEIRQDVVAIVSHDLRNPLSAIRLSASLLAKRPSEIDRRSSRKQVEIILRSVEHMQRLIERVLDVSTLEAGTFKLDRAREEVIPLVDELLQELEPVAASKAIHLFREVLGEIPQIWCDRTRVQQVLSNLVGNALKFVPVDGTIRIRIWAQADEVHFEVADTGPGIPERELPHLFERYWTDYRGRGRSVGLGLFITRGIVEAHGGRISVESKHDVPLHDPGISGRRACD